MEKNHMFSAFGGSEAQVALRDKNVDRFSALPDNVFHHILSFNTNFKEFTRMSGVSKRCKQLYLSAPSLKIYNSGGNKQEQLDLMNCVDRFLLHREYNKMRIMRISWSFCSGIADEIYRLINWSLIAVRSNVEVLKLEVMSSHSPDTVELPACIVRCESLRCLVVSCYAVLIMPTFASFTNLQILKLKYVRVDERFWQWMSSSSCKCIKDLRLYEVKADRVIIESSSLESFRYVVNGFSNLSSLSISGEKLVYVHMDWGFYRSSSRSLKISAPNCKTLKWFGRVLNHQELGEFACLEKAEILLEHMEPYKFDNVSEVLGSISRTKALTLLEETVKVLFSESSIPYPLKDVSFLSMHIGSLNDDLVPAMVSLLSGMSSLNTLHICTYPSHLVDKPKACGFNKKYWESQNLPCIHQLEEVEIELSHGRNSLELVCYMLEHAQSLKKMVIFGLSHQSDMLKRVNKCKMASAPTIIFQKKVPELKRRPEMCRYLTGLRDINDRMADNFLLDCIVEIV